jgi:hypothetical protein
LVLTALLWLLSTIALAVALPIAWVQHNIVDVDGYAAFAHRAASDPVLQQAVASELTTQIGNLASSKVSPGVVGMVASGYTASSAFPGQFAQANRVAHRWMFTMTVHSEVDVQGRWVVDLAPMLSDSSFQETVNRYNIQVPSSLPVPLSQNAPATLRPGRLQSMATWGPWVSAGAAVLTGVLALLTVAVARRHGKTIAALGISALLVGAAGWAGLEVGLRYIGTALAGTSGDIRQIADSIVAQAVSSMHQWLNVTLAVGGGLVLVGVLVTLLGGIGHRSVREPAS